MLLGFTIFGFAMPLVLPTVDKVKSGEMYGFNSGLTGTLASNPQTIVQESRPLTSVLKHPRPLNTNEHETVAIYVLSTYSALARAIARTGAWDGQWDQALEIPNGQTYVIVYTDDFGNQRTEIVSI